MGPECEEIQREMNLYRQGKLDEAEKAHIESHLLFCPECIFLLTLVPSLNES